MLTLAAAAVVVGVAVAVAAVVVAVAAVLAAVVSAVAVVAAAAVVAVAAEMQVQPWGEKAELWEVSSHCRHLHNLHSLHTDCQSPLHPWKPDLPCMLLKPSDNPS